MWRGTHEVEDFFFLETPPILTCTKEGVPLNLYLSLIDKVSSYVLVKEKDKVK